MDASPSLTDDGSVILGKRLSRVYVLDRATGHLLQHLSDVLPSPEQQHHHHAHGGKGPGSPLGIEGKSGGRLGHEACACCCRCSPQGQHPAHTC